MNEKKLVVLVADLGKELDTTARTLRHHLRTHGHSVQTTPGGAGVTQATAAWLRSQYSSPDGWAFLGEISDMCGLWPSAVMGRVRKQGMDVRRWGVRNLVIIDLDDWWGYWLDRNEVHRGQEEPQATPGSTTCLVCGERWESPDPIRVRYCPPCRANLRRQELAPGWAEFAA